MSRPLRIQFPSAWYHVMNRGRHREEIIVTKKDSPVFVTLLEEAASLFKYCIAPTKSQEDT